MSKVLSAVGTIAGLALAVLSAPFTGGASLLAGSAFLGMSVGTVLFVVATAATIGASLLAGGKPKSAPQDQASRLQLSINPREPRKMVFGTTAMATDVRDQEFTDNQTYMHRWVVVASHRVSAIREIWFDSELAWTAAGGVQGKWAQYLTVTPVLEGNASTVQNVSPRMGASRRYTGLAYVYLRYRLTGLSKKAESPFAQSVPNRVTIVGDGCPVYDPRMDSTVPGGSGPCRVDDQATWRTEPEAVNNAALILLTWFLGWRINGLLAVGKGIPGTRFLLPAFITAANVCDEPVSKPGGGAEPRYRAAGVFSEGDGPTTIIDNLKASMHCELDDIDGRIRPMIYHNDLAAPIAHFTEDDVVGEFDWSPVLPLDQAANITRGTFVDPSTTSLYQPVDYPPIEEPNSDGIDRIDAYDLNLVQSGSQAQRLARLRHERRKVAGRFSARFQATGWRVQKGSVVTFTFGPCGFVMKLFRVEEHEVDTSGTVAMVLREEAPAIYDLHVIRDPVDPIAASPYDPALSPVVQELAGVASAVDLQQTIISDYGTRISNLEEIQPQGGG